MMGQRLPGSARTTEATRRAIQQSQESLTVLAAGYGINDKTVATWRQRGFVHDAPMGPKEPASTVLTKAEEALCVAFRQQTLWPLDDGLYALQPSIPPLSRSALPRCDQRQGSSRLPDIEGNTPAKKKLKSIRSATSLSTGRRCGRRKGSGIYSWRSTAPARSRTQRGMRHRIETSQRLSCALGSQPFQTRSIRSSPITAASYVIHPGIATDRRLRGSRICSIAAAMSTESTTDSPSPSIRGQTGRWSA